MLFITQHTLGNSECARRWRICLPLAFVHILFAGVALGQDKSVSVETIERARYAAVPIVCLVKRPDGSLRLHGTVGSAFFINDEGYFVTAAHILTGLERWTQSKEACFPAVYSPTGKWSHNPTQNLQWFGFSTCVKNERRDIAVCRTEENPFKHPLVKKEVRFVTFAARSTLPEGTAIAFTGFPLNLTRPVTSKGYIASHLPAENTLMIDKTTWKGASGSPLYLADGTVVGIVVSKGIDESAGLSFARTVEVITDFLTQNKITFRQQK